MLNIARRLKNFTEPVALGRLNCAFELLLGRDCLGKRGTDRRKCAAAQLLWLSTIAFTLLFNVWLMLGVLSLSHSHRAFAFVVSA